MVTDADFDGGGKPAGVGRRAVSGADGDEGATCAAVMPSG